MALFAAILTVSLLGCASVAITDHPLIGVWQLETVDGKPHPGSEHHFMTFFEKYVVANIQTQLNWNALMDPAQNDPTKDPYGYVLPRGGEQC